MANAAANAPPLDEETRTAYAESAMALEELIRRHSEGSFETWSQTFLPDLFFEAPGAFHRKLYQDAEDLLAGRPIDGEVRASLAIACPRNHGKTTAMVIGMPIYVALEYQNLPFYRDNLRGRAPYIVIISDTIDQARSRVMDIRDELEKNEQLRAKYGDQAPERGQRRRRKWTETHLELANGVIIRAMGFGSKVRGLVRRGRRPNLLLCDDMENDQAVETEKRREKLRGWFLKALMPTGKAGELVTIVVGTVLHADSLLARLIGSDGHEGWVKRRYAAQMNREGLPDVDGDVILWPEYWTRAQLEQRRREIGTLAYTQEYLNQPIDDESSAFRLAWLQAALNRGFGRRWATGPSPRIPWSAVTSTWDPLELADTYGTDAMQVLITAWDIGIIDDEDRARKADGDYSVGITVGLDCSDRIVIRRAFRKRGMTPKQFRERVILEQQTVEADYIVIEANAAQRIHELELRDKKLPIIGHVTTGVKNNVWTGVPGMAFLFESNRIDLCHATEGEKAACNIITRELHGLGREAHDDTVMSLWMALAKLRVWMFRRNQRRRKLLGNPPPGMYESPFALGDRENEQPSNERDRGMRGPKGRPELAPV